MEKKQYETPDMEIRRFDDESEILTIHKLPGMDIVSEYHAN